MALSSLSQVFNKLYLKVIDPNTMQVLKVEVAEIMSILEKVFPPTCFDIMTHLVIHLVEELDICGLAYIRWMYPMEKYMKALKRFVQNMARPKGNMAIGYSIEEALGLCMEYIPKVKSTRRKVWDDKKEPTMHNEVLEGNGHFRKLSTNLKVWAHTFVLHNATAT